MNAFSKIVAGLVCVATVACGKPNEKEPEVISEPPWAFCENFDYGKNECLDTALKNDSGELSIPPGNSAGEAEIIYLRRIYKISEQSTPQAIQAIRHLVLRYQLRNVWMQIPVKLTGNYTYENCIDNCVNSSDGDSIILIEVN